MRWNLDCTSWFFVVEFAEFVQVVLVLQTVMRRFGRHQCLLTHRMPYVFYIFCPERLDRFKYVTSRDLIFVKYYVAFTRSFLGVI